MSDTPSRILALQPRLVPGDLADPVMENEDPMVLGILTNVLRVWAMTEGNMPDDFIETMSVRSVARQPLTFVTAEVEEDEPRRPDALLFPRATLPQPKSPAPATAPAVPKVPRMVVKPLRPLPGAASSPPPA